MMNAVEKMNKINEIAEAIQKRIAKADHATATYEHITADGAVDIDAFEAFVTFKPLSHPTNAEIEELFLLGDELGCDIQPMNRALLEDGQDRKEYFTCF